MDLLYRTLSSFHTSVYIQSEVGPMWKHSAEGIEVVPIPSNVLHFLLRDHCYVIPPVSSGSTLLSLPSWTFPS